MVRDDFHCTFCDKPRKAVRKLISGPRVFICDECVSACEPRVLAPDRVFPGRRESHRPNGPKPDFEDHKENQARGPDACSFCGKGREDVLVLVYGYFARICNECLPLCRDIITEEAE